MKLRTWLLVLLAAVAVGLLLAAATGCGGASLNTGKNRNLEQVDPDFIDPPWYEDFENDKRAAYGRYKGKVIEVSVRVTDTEEGNYGTEITGSTGLEERYRVSCIFPQQAEASLENVRSGSMIEVKGLFDHMQELSNSYKLYLVNCVLVQ